MFEISLVGEYFFQITFSLSNRTSMLFNVDGLINDTARECSGVLSRSPFDDFVPTAKYVFGGRHSSVSMTIPTAT